MMDYVRRAFSSYIVCRRRRRRTTNIFVLLSCIVVYIFQLRLMIDMVERMATTPAEKRLRLRPTTTTTTLSLLPSCHPHWRVGTTPSNNKTIGDPAISRSENDDDATTSPIKRIYFYHVRKAGGTMIRKYLRKVASRYRIQLRVLEYKHASSEEEVGSRTDTFYVTNMRDPVERSVSHFKYDARWGCDQLVKNSSNFVPTSDNAMPFESWNFTGGFEKSSCDEPFSFVSCAVNCYVQVFSGGGCTRDDWYTEYNLAWDRLLRYNMILVYSKFGDTEYVRAVEDFFGGVGGFNEPSSMFCGEEAREANRKVPLRVSFEHVLRLTRLNAMDNRLYRDMVTSCFDEMEEEQRGGGGGGGGGGAAAARGHYSFPRVDTSRFVAQKNRTVVD